MSTRTLVLASAIAETRRRHPKSIPWIGSPEALVELEFGRCFRSRVSHHRQRDAHVCFVVSYYQPHGGLVKQVLLGLQALGKKVHLVLTGRKRLGAEAEGELRMLTHAISRVTLDDFEDSGSAGRVLRPILDFGPESVLAHITPSDAIGALLLRALDQLPVYFVDHNNHTPTLFGSRQPIVLQISRFGEFYTSQHRLRPELLHYPLSMYPDIGPRDCRTSINAGRRLVVAATNATKLRGDGGTFLETLSDLARSFRRWDFVLFLFGSSSKLRSKLARAERSGVIIRGWSENLPHMLRQSTLLLDSWPLGGTLTRLMAIGCGVPTLSLYNRHLAAMTSTEWLLGTPKHSPSSTQEFQSMVGEALSRPEKARALLELQEQHQRTQGMFVDDLSAALSGSKPNRRSWWRPEIELSTTIEEAYDPSEYRSIMKAAYPLQHQPLSGLIGSLTRLW